MALSRDPQKRRNQLANLKQGGDIPRPGRPPEHGAYARISRQRLERKEREVLDAVSEDAPLRNADGSLPAADGAVIRLLAEALIRLDSISSYLRDHGLLDPKTGEVRGAVEIEGRIRREALDLCEALAMTPRSRVRLGVALVQAAANSGDEEAARAARDRLDQRFAAIDADAAEEKQ